MKYNFHVDKIMMTLIVFSNGEHLKKNFKLKLRNNVENKYGDLL